jgi:hypothetical protein
MKLLPILIYLLLFLSYTYIIYNYSKELLKSLFKADEKIYNIAYGICLLLPGLMLLYLLRGEQNIYMWDYSAYWVKSIEFTNHFAEHPIKTIWDIIRSVNYEEYNSTPNILLGPANTLLGLNFNEYVFSVYLIYYLPFALVISNTIFLATPGVNNRLKPILPLFILLFTPCLIPLRFGFIDMVGLMYIAIILCVLVRSDYFRTIQYKQAAISGLLLLLLIFSRRWYAFWFVAFYVAVFLTNTIRTIQQKDYKPMVAVTINLFIAGIIPVIIMLVFFYPFFEMSVLKDYRDIYSGYRGHSGLHQLNGLLKFFGGFIIVTAVAGLLLSVKREKNFTLFLIISTLVIVMLFTRINDFGGYQHNYLLVPFVILFFARGVLYLSRYSYVLTGIFMLLLANNYFVFSKNSYSENSYVFSGIMGKAENRTDYMNLASLADRVSTLQQDGNIVYCLASGSALSDDILRNIRLPKLDDPIFKLQGTQHVDKRDAFPNRLFFSNYVVTTLTPQVHLGENNQKLIAYFNRQVISGTLKNHYTEVARYTLRDGAVAVVLKKTAGYSNDEITTILNYFKNAYPDYPKMYDGFTNIMKLTEAINGDNFGNVNFADNNSIDISPGADRPTSITYTIDPTEKTMTFTATFINKESLLHDCNPEKDGEVYLTILADGKQVDKKYITHRADEKITLDVAGKTSVTLIVDHGRNEDYCDWFKLINFDIK